MPLFGTKTYPEMPDNCTGYGDPSDNINQNLSDALVNVTSVCPTTTTVSDTIQVQAQDAVMQVQVEMQKMQAEIAMQREQMRQDADTPFDETDDFRDYVVWLCGYTQRKTPPSQDEWNDLRNETKKVAAKFALRARAKRALRRGAKSVHDDMTSLSGVTTTTASMGISGSTTLTGNEEAMISRPFSTY